MAAKSGGKTFFFCEKSPVESASTLWVKNFVVIALSRSVSEVNVFYTEIEDGRQKWRENNFYKKLPEHSADTLWVKNFVEIALSHSIYEINAFCFFSVKKNRGV